MGIADMKVGVGGYHFTKPHFVEGYTRSDGTYVPGYWRDGDGDTSVNLTEQNGGGYYQGNPDGLSYNNLGGEASDFIPSNIDREIEFAQPDVKEIIAGDTVESNSDIDPQIEANSCAVSTQKNVMEEISGQDLSEAELIDIAEINNWYDPLSGTTLGDVGNLLELNGIEIEKGINWTLEDLVHALNSDERVITAINGNEIWYPKYDQYGEPLEQEAVGHAIQVTGIVKDSSGEIYIAINDTGVSDGSSGYVAWKDFENAWQDYQNFAVVTDLDETNIRVELEDYNLKDLDPDTALYIESMKQETVSGDFPDAEIIHEYNDIIPDMANAFATGGFIALLEIFKGQPIKQKRVVSAGIALGMFDGILDIEEIEVENGFDLNPLFLASIASAIILRVSSSQNKKLKSFANSFNKVSAKAFGTIKTGAYGALGLKAIDLALPGLDLVDNIDSAIDGIGLFEKATLGADIIDGFASLGVGIAASRGVKWIMDLVNEEDRERIKTYQTEVTKREIKRAFLKSDMPSTLLVGPIGEMEG